jgi:hypothetical protein
MKQWINRATVAANAAMEAAARSVFQRTQDQASLTVVALPEGQALICLDPDDPARMSPGDVAIARGTWRSPGGRGDRPGDVAIVRGPQPYTALDDLGNPVPAVVHPGPRCATPDGTDLYDAP